MESSTKGGCKKIPDSAIQHSLYGYKEMRLVSSEEVLSTLLKGQMRKCGGSLPDTPPLSPRKIRTPDEISLCSSSLPGCKFGACAIKRIQHGTWFGPFEGKLVRTSEMKGMTTDYMWEIFHDGEVSHFLDGFNESNWMAFVRCARHKREQNLVVFQYHGCIYYRSVKDILPGNELLVWYDSKYTQLLGIPLTWNDNRGTANKRKNSLSICTEEPTGYPQQQLHSTQRKKREKVTPLSLLQQIDYKQHQQYQHNPSRKNELEFLASLIAKNAPSALSSNGSNNVPSFMTDNHSSSPSSKKDAPSSVRCDRCFFTFHSKEQLISHKCINSSSWLHQYRAPPTALSSRVVAEKHLHHPLHVNTPGFSHGVGGGVEAAPPSSSTSINPQFMHNYYQNLSHAYPSPPMEPMKNFNTTSSYKTSLLLPPLKNY